MKKIAILLSVIIFSVSLVACSNKTEDIHPNDEASTGIVIDDAGYADFTEEQIVQYIERVELTLDNWDLYFEDYCRESEKESINSFGEVSYYKDYRCGFGIKEGIAASFHNVAFKFAGVEACEKHYSTWISEEEAAQVQLIDFASSSHPKEFQKHYTKYDCIDIVGELYIYHFPDEIKGFYINKPMGDVYSVSDSRFTPPGDYIAELYSRYHK